MLIYHFWVLFRYIIPVDPPYPPKSANPTGYYRMNVTLTKSWLSRNTRIQFGAVDSCFYLWANGQFIGFSKDSRLPAEFDLSDVIRSSFINKSDGTIIAETISLCIEVIVLRFSDGFYLGVLNR